jgi:TrmH family RNA methyltransferase
MTNVITSRENAVFQRVRNAIFDHDREIAIEGPKMIMDAMGAGWKPIVIVRSESAWNNEWDGLKPLPTAFSNALFRAVSDTNTSQGLIGVFERPRQADVFARTDSIVVALDGVQDPGNVGTIIRLAAAFDAAGVALLAGCADPFGPKAVRASAGAVLTVPIAAIGVKDLEGRALYAAEGAGDPADPPARNAVLIFGNEGAGVSDALRARATRISIAMSERVESLNVAAAAAILLSRSFVLRKP